MTIGGRGGQLAAWLKRARAQRWWVQVLGIYAASRIVSTTWLALVYSLASANHWQFVSSRVATNFATFSAAWDGSYYRRIATSGYPALPPMDASGNLLPNEWAFLPVYPGLVRAINSITGLDFDRGAIAVSVVAGAGAALALYVLVRSHVGRPPAIWAAILFCFGPLAFIFQMVYAESLFLLLIFLSLIALVRRNYALFSVFGVVAAFTRPGALALVAALGIHLIASYRRHTPVLARAKAIGSGVVIAAAGLTWPLVASAMTGRSTTYIDTELSWWTGFVGRPSFVPFTPWFLFAGRYLGVAGIALVIAALIAFVWLLSHRGARALGAEIVGFCAAYGLYLFAVFLPQQSLFRVALPMSPLLGVPSISRSRWLRRVLLAASIVLQPVAIVLLWFIGYP